MKMSDDEENYCYFGKPLEPYDDDAFPKKKPISVEDQIATDAQGRRRFHGAFTGGFSAGFFNTVGSLEGWTPSEFRSTRQDKTQSKVQKPQDFMDEEDISEFGIAPETVRATKEYATNKKRRRQVYSAGPIPGEPVLYSLLKSGNDTVGYLLLKNIGLKNKTNLLEGSKSEERMYGCEMPVPYEMSRDDILIPNIIKDFLKKPKDNTFGLGYEALNRTDLKGFKSAGLVIKERNRKVVISGQAFGVGAFEDDDEDIYVKDDMSRYDFELTSEKILKKAVSKSEDVIFDEFVKAMNPLPGKETFSPPTIPHSFIGKHKVKKSRFEPLAADDSRKERPDLDPEIRAEYLGEKVSVGNNEENVHISTSPTSLLDAKPAGSQVEKLDISPDRSIKKKFDLFSLQSTNQLFDRFVTSSLLEDTSDTQKVTERSEITHGTQEMRDASRMKMFGPLTRITTDWQPCSLICKRFNVPEPHFNELDTSKTRKKMKNIIFEYEQFAKTNDDLCPGLSVRQNVENADVKTSGESQHATENNETVLNTDVDITMPNEDKEESKDIPSTLVKDITEKIDVSRNVDLFKAVFMSSSESEAEEDEHTANKSNEMKDSILSENLLPRIKPLKEGILSNMDLSVFDKSDNVAKDKSEDQLKPNLSEVRNIYGPLLPGNSGNAPAPTVSNSCTQYTQQDDDDQWVEKTKADKKKKSHKNKKGSHRKKHKDKKKKK